MICGSRIFKLNEIVAFRSAKVCQTLLSRSERRQWRNIKKRKRVNCMDCRKAQLFGKLRRFMLPIITRRVSEVPGRTSLTRRVVIACMDLRPWLILSSLRD
jgi:hypothetical protein